MTSQHQKSANFFCVLQIFDQNVCWHVSYSPLRSTSVCLQSSDGDYACPFPGGWNFQQRLGIENQCRYISAARRIQDAYWHWDTISGLWNRHLDSFSDTRCDTLYLRKSVCRARNNVYNRHV